MNDLAEKALDGLIAARRAIAARPVPALGVSGFVFASTIVVTGARLGAAPAAVPIDRWLGLLPEAGYHITGVAMGLVMLAAIVGLLATWIVAFVVAVRTRLATRALWTLGAVWALPFVVGPPLLSTDVFGYVARGLISRAGGSPYSRAPSDLGELRIVDAIDPTWRGTQSSDGPLSTLLGHLVVSLCGGAIVPALLVFRVIALASVVVIGRCAHELSAGHRPQSALCLTILNPAVLLFVVSAGQLVGLFAALLLVTLVATRRRRWAGAAVSVALAAALKPAALVAVPVVIAYHVFGQPRREIWRRGLRDVGLIAAVLTASTLAVPRGLGWLANLGDAFHEHLRVHAGHRDRQSHRTRRARRVRRRSDGGAHRDSGGRRGRSRRSTDDDAVAPDRPDARVHVARECARSARALPAVRAVVRGVPRVVHRSGAPVADRLPRGAVLRRVHRDSGRARRGRRRGRFADRHRCDRVGPDRCALDAAAPLSADG